MNCPREMDISQVRDVIFIISINYNQEREYPPTTLPKLFDVQQVSNINSKHHNNFISFCIITINRGSAIIREEQSFDRVILKI